MVGLAGNRANSAQFELGLGLSLAIINKTKVESVQLDKICGGGGDGGGWEGCVLTHFSDQSKLRLINLHIYFDFRSSTNK